MKTIEQNSDQPAPIRKHPSRWSLRLIWIGFFLTTPLALLMLDFPTAPRQGPAALDGLLILLWLLVSLPLAGIGVVLAGIAFSRLWIQQRLFHDARAKVAAWIGLFGLLLYLPAPFLAFRLGDLLKADMPNIDGRPAWSVFHDQYAPFGLLGVVVMLGGLVLFSIAVRAIPKDVQHSPTALSFFTMRRFIILLICICGLLVLTRFFAFGHFYWIAIVLTSAAMAGRAMLRIPVAAEREYRGLLPIAIGFFWFCYCYAIGVHTALASFRPGATLASAVGCALALTLVAFGHVRRFYRVTVTEAI